MTDLKSKTNSELATTFATFLAECGCISTAKCQEISALPFSEALQESFDVVADPGTRLDGISGARAEEYKAICSEIDQRIAVMRAEKKALNTLTDHEKAEAVQLNMTEAAYLEAKKNVAAKYASAPVSPRDLNSLTDREKAEASQLGLSEAQYLESKREVAAKYRY